MYRTIRHISAALAAIAALALAPACQLRPLADPSELVKINVTVDTDNISNVSCDFYNPNITYPGISTDMIRCMFYDPQTGKLLSQAFIQDKSLNANGQEVLSGTVKILSGNFDIVCYNFDTPNTLVRDENEFQTITSYTSNVASAIKSRFSVLADKAGDEKVVNTPDHLMVSRDIDYRIAPHAELTTIETTATTIVDTYYIQIKVKNGKYASATSAVLSGLSPENKFALNERNVEDPASIFFDMQLSQDSKKYGATDNEVLCAVFNTFGKIDQATSDLAITVSVTTTEGKTVEKTVAMDKIFATADAKNHHWLIIDDVIEIPVPDDPQGQGGFNPEVDDWDEEHGEITL